VNYIFIYVRDDDCEQEPQYRQTVHYVSGITRNDYDDFDAAHIDAKATIAAMDKKDGTTRELVCALPCDRYDELWARAGRPGGHGKDTPYWKFVLRLLDEDGVADLRQGSPKMTYAASRKPRRDPDHAPNYWDLRDKDGNLKVNADAAMDAVRSMSKGG
jgi:hypothetical protein